MKTEKTHFPEESSVADVDPDPRDFPTGDAVDGPMGSSSSVAQCPRPSPSLMKRVGIAGFVFFLVKGMLWLVVGYAAMMANGCTSWGE
ncbi:MAG TPA: hypothetical protein PKN33_05925 [Phycisphaerae bacterium]|nr:hypothetical protein [Phycisphaerae bacterium]